MTCRHGLFEACGCSEEAWVDKMMRRSKPQPSTDTRVEKLERLVGALLDRVAQLESKASQ